VNINENHPFSHANLKKKSNINERGISRHGLMFHRKQYTSTSRLRTERDMSEQMILEAVPLNALDRCDRCGAQAYVRAVLLSGGELLFCGHHGKEYAEKIRPLAAKIQDETSKLVESPAAN
jgi:hypothetical protein